MRLYPYNLVGAILKAFFSTVALSLLSLSPLAASENEVRPITGMSSTASSDSIDPYILQAPVAGVFCGARIGF